MVKKVRFCEVKELRLYVLSAVHGMSTLSKGVSSKIII